MKNFILIIIIAFSLNVSAQAQYSSGLPVLQDHKLPPGDKTLLSLAGSELETYHKLVKTGNIVSFIGYGFMVIGITSISVDKPTPPMLIMGAIATSVGGIIHLTAPKHIGKSGAYLRAYANGVKLTF